jgi:hypothetical protein
MTVGRSASSSRLGREGGRSIACVCAASAIGVNAC